MIIAEDDADDQILIGDALEENGVSPYVFEFAKDGVELIEMLNDARVSPSVIIMDLNMPRKDGRETLQEIKSSDIFKHIPFIVFTTSSASEDVQLTYKYGANSFFTKPDTFNGLIELFALFKKYWMEEATLALEFSK